ncbi:unnamed protein product [Dovyalis caffra]|uniref:ABC-type xenobiotic transporter n=1 Tax=Dovyalis caffra TaxID=77055 RepID=A0AAV1S3U9_9ROSI|nr:unnamed protein product [Dovyalis caffra]
MDSTRQVCGYYALKFSKLLRRRTIKTAREVARMVVIQKAQLLHHFSETIAGAATIRCFDQEEQFYTKNLGLVDDFSRIFFQISGSTVACMDRPKDGSLEEGQVRVLFAPLKHEKVASRFLRNSLDIMHQGFGRRSFDLEYLSLTEMLLYAAELHRRGGAQGSSQRKSCPPVLECAMEYKDELERHLLNKDVDALKVDDPFTKAGFWSKITFRWLNPLFSKGHREKLEVYDIPTFPQSAMADKAYSLLEESLQKDKTETPSLAKAIFCSIWGSLALNAIFAGVYAIASYTGPFLIAKFIHLLSSKVDDSSHYGFVLASIFFVAKTAESLSQRQWYFGACQIGIKIRAAMLALLYKKLLRVRSDGARNGKIINYINTDTEKVVEFIQRFQEVWLLPFQVMLALIILIKHLGWIPSILAVLAAVLIMASNTPLSNLQKRLQSRIMEAKDRRIKATSETLKSIKVLKLHAWEPSFLDKLLHLRETERGWLVKFLYAKSAVVFLYWTSPILISLMTFGVCTILDKKLSSGSIFSALATLQLLHEPIYNMPELFSAFAHASISIIRLQEFLREDNQEKSKANNLPRKKHSAIDITSGEYAWETSNTNILQPTVTIGENMRIMESNKVSICGSVGSGKSSLLLSILREIPRISGRGIEVFGSTAYVPQTPWIQSGTTRDNILFGNNMNEAFYKNVIEACALQEDLERLAHKDFTVVGERGITLSGGQKQRIQLARAIYSKADVYLLDDPFSAVDAHTKAHLFKHCLMGLLSDKTVIYVTHQLEFLAASDLVLVMKDGRIVQSGAYKDLVVKPQGELNRLMVAHCESLSQLSSTQGSSITSGSNLENQNQDSRETNKQVSNGQSMPVAKQEERGSGRVSWKAYSSFITTAYKGAFVPVLLLFHVLFQALQMGSSYWIAWATEQEDRVSKKQLLGIFALVSGASSLFVLARALLLTVITIKTAQLLFIGMMTSIFRAPMSFFDTTSSSQILDRSSTDQATVDTDISYRLAGLVFALIQLISVIFLLSHVTWQVSLLFLAIFAISAWYHVYYIETARELARMVGIQKAPILHHFSESVTGVVTIRCFSQEKKFYTSNVNLINDFSRVAFFNSATMEWLCVRINFLFNLGFFAVLVILVSIPGSATNTSLAGLAVTYGLNINVLQAWVIWNVCNVENKMISVERILQFSRIPSEAPPVIEDKRPRTEWPEIGCIEFRNLQVRYSPDLPLVLKGITCTFPGAKKIGIVGRTGSGKSTLIQALFRLVDSSQGQILIDGLDISTIGLRDLRSKLSIIPQDPTLFQGTIRSNVDPVEQHNDFEVWEILRKCHLAGIVKQDQRGLEAPVAEEGQNWSLGQRQLICMARILLQKRKILVLDEATASIDMATDNIIQKTVSNETNECTVITIAHQITSVISSDLVLFLDDGNVVECASPRELMRDSSSAFSKLVKEFSGNSSQSNVVECAGPSELMRDSSSAFSKLQCLKGLLSDKTVIYVSHQLEFLAASDLVLAYYLKTARELARMVGIQKAPLLHHFSETIAGAVTIRCFDQEEQFYAKNLSLVDDYSRISFHNSATMEWLCVRINFLFNLGFFVVLIILVTVSGSDTSPSLAGLAVTYGLKINILQAWVIWNVCNVESKMISVERILRFRCTASKAPLVIKDKRPEPEWPETGCIEIKDLDRLWDFLAENDLNPNASLDIEYVNTDGNAAGKKQQDCKINIINFSDDSKQLSEGVKCPDDGDESSESLEEGELPRTHHKSIREFEVSEIGCGEFFKCTFSRVGAYSGDLGVGGENSIQHKKIYTSEPSFLVS